MTPIELQIDDHVYRIGKLDALSQFHVARRLAPVMAAIGGKVVELASSNPGMPQDEWMMTLFAPVADAVSRLTDDDSNYIITTVLSVVYRQQDEKWAPVQVNKRMMFLDIDMQLMLRLTVESIKGNLGSFFSGVVGGQL